MAEKDPPQHVWQAAHLVLSPQVSSPDALTLRPITKNRELRCHPPPLFLITSHFNLDLHVYLSELGQGLYKALVSNSPNNKQEKA